MNERDADLLAALKDLREASACMMRVISKAIDEHGGSIVEDLRLELEKAGIERGFGVRAEHAIQKAERC